MSISGDLIGRQSAPQRFHYDWRRVVLYALGVGARADELDYLYEGRGPKVLPTFAVIPSFDALLSVAGDLGQNPMMIVHGEQRVILHRPIPLDLSGCTLITVSEITGVYDKGKGALVVVEARTKDEQGRPMFDNQFSIFVRGAGGFGGPRGPEAVPADPPQRAPDWEVTERTTPEQALLYRLSGDLNPLHADPAMARFGGFDRPILHGLCTFGFAGRALVRSACQGNGDLVRSFGARFSAPVFPGETLTTRGWQVAPGRHVIRVANQDGKDVLTNAIAEVGPVAAV